jgi:hypothetical protein
LVLRALFDSINGENYSREFDLNAGNIEVIREFTTPRNKRIDLLIKSNEFVVVVENKIFHGVENDLEHYEEVAIAQALQIGPVTEVFCVLLVLFEDKEIIQGRRVNGTNFFVMSYPYLFDKIRRLIGEYVSDGNLKHMAMLTDFIQTMENIKSGTVENQRLSQFFQQNYDSVAEMNASFEEFKKRELDRVSLLKEKVEARIGNGCSAQVQLGIWKREILYFDFKVNSEEGRRIFLDVRANLSSQCWEFMLGGRDSKSKTFLKEHFTEFFASYQTNSFQAPHAKFPIKPPAIVDFSCDLEIVAKQVCDVLDSVQMLVSRS